MPKELEGKIAIVTGAGAGIGRAICEDFARQGAIVIVTDITEERAKSVAASITESGGKSGGYKMDVTSDEDVKKVFDGVMKRFGRVDILVNNAAAPSATIGKPTMFDRSMDEWDKGFQVDLKGLARCCKHAYYIMREQKSGRIINVASIAGKVPTQAFADYGAMKGGVLSFTRTLATELAPFGVTVNSINPGYLFTELWEHTAKLIAKTLDTDTPPTAEQIFTSIVTKSTPMGVPQEVEDIAHATTFLCSEKARYITGQALHIDGGACMY